LGNVFAEQTSVSVIGYFRIQLGYATPPPVSRVDLDNLAIANLVTGWLPALDDVAEKLTARATVVDVGNGYGARRHPRRTR